MIGFSRVFRLSGLALIAGYLLLESLSSPLVLMFAAILFIVGWVGGVRRRLEDPTHENVAPSGKTPEIEVPLLHMAARRGDIAEMGVLLSHGFPIEGRSENYTTPLHWTAFKGHLEATRYLVDRGADVNARDQFGTPP